MTFWDVLRVAVRRWWVTLLCVALTGGLVFWANHAQPSYLTRDRVVLLAPANAQLNAFGTTSQSLIDLAGVVARRVQGADARASVVSGGVTIVGEGIRKGTSVLQPNDGGQWAYNFEAPVVDVQAVDATSGGSRRLMAEALQQVRTALSEVQDQQGVSAVNRVRTSYSPAVPQVVVIRGSSTRALAASILIGAIATGSLLAVLGRPRSRSRRTARLVAQPDGSA